LIDESIFAPHFKTQPFWWDGAPRPQGPPGELPAQVDVAIIGSGYTGLSAALTLARAGKEVAVLEAEEPGYGASSRNAGYVGRTLKHSFSSLVKTEGLAQASAMYGEVDAAFNHVVDLIEREQIQCQYTQCGRFMGARSASQYEAMAAELEVKRKHLGQAYEMVPRATQHTEIGSDLYHGGAMLPELGGMHPGLYHLGLLDRAEQAGVDVLPHTRVLGVERSAQAFEVRTARGRVRAGNVLVATNGYTRGATPWFRRRLIPFRGFMIATEPLEPEQIGRILPNMRTAHDFNNNLQFLRRSPDGSRLLLGGLTGTIDDNLKRMASRLHRLLSAIVPDMAPVKLTHAWNGFCAATFDQNPHVGVQDGVHYAMGYCFAGLPMGTYLGHKAALRILGDAEAATVFDDLPFESRAWYWGTPWFLPAYMRYLDHQDRVSMKK
jgi:glycine/D-amino acid oxidase-like deaminating enzyme